MQIGNFTKNYKPQAEKGKEKISNQRQYWISKFIEKIEAKKKRENLYRFWLWRGKKINPKFIKMAEMDLFINDTKQPVEKRYLKPWKDSRYAMKVSHIKTEELAPFYDMCMRADDSKTGYDFSVCFFHSLKVEKKK